MLFEAFQNLPVVGWHRLVRATVAPFIFATGCFTPVGKGKSTDVLLPLSAKTG